MHWCSKALPQGTISLRKWHVTIPLMLSYSISRRHLTAGVLVLRHPRLLLRLWEAASSNSSISVVLEWLDWLNCINSFQPRSSPSSPSLTGCSIFLITKTPNASVFRLGYYCVILAPPRRLFTAKTLTLGVLPILRKWYVNNALMLNL